jgi:hypothetical protein
MDKETKSRVTHITNEMSQLMDDIDYIKSELHRLTFVEEEANPPTDTLIYESANDNATRSHGPQSHHGVVTLPLHYTLGRGVPEALGDDVESVVLTVYRRVLEAGDRAGLQSREVDLCGTGMAIDAYFDRDNQSICLHIELVHTDDSIIWGEAEEEATLPPRRSLN